MANPYLPKWEYIPDGEPRVFGDRVYIYGSHDMAGNSQFCDCVLKCWSAPVDNPNEWVCHGDIFRVGKTRDHESDTDWTGENGRLFGAVTSKEIAEALKKDFDITVDKKKILLTESIKVAGATKVDIKLNEGVLANVQVLVVPEE